jgi:hypothetical protein
MDHSPAKVIAILFGNVLFFCVVLPFIFGGWAPFVAFLFVMGFIIYATINS